MNGKLLGAMLALILSATAHAQLYKWVDSEGKIHYSDQPPPAGATKEEKLNIKKAPSAPGAAPETETAPSGPKTTAEQEMDYRKRKVEDEQARQKAQAEEKENQEQCLNAQRRLRGYEDSGRIFTVDDQGERAYVDDEARERAVQQARQDIAKYCK